MIEARLCQTAPGNPVGFHLRPCAQWKGVPYKNTTGLVDVAYQSIQALNSHELVKASVQIPLASAAKGNGGFGPGKSPCQSYDLTGLQPGDPGNGLRGVVPEHHGFESHVICAICGGPVVKTESVIFHKRTVIDTLADDHVGKAQGKGRFGSGPGSQPLICLRSSGGAS